jgi:hypothetical protein
MTEYLFHRKEPTFVKKAELNHPKSDIRCREWGSLNVCR